MDLSLPWMSKAGGGVDPYARLEKLIASAEPRYQRRFMEVVRQIRNAVDLEKLEALIKAGRSAEALIEAELTALRLGNLWHTEFVTAGQATAGFLSGALNIVIDFNQVNFAAVNAMRLNELRLVTAFNQEMRQATQTALLDGIRAGTNPRAVALEFRDSIGLTPNQVSAVNNYRRMLENGDRQFATRTLRDRRFDSTVLRSIEDDRSLSSSQVGRMVERYREKMLAYRAETISRTEALRSVHEGNRAMYQEAVEGGALDPTELFRTWIPAHDERVRESHRAMDGQRRGLDEAFTSGLGNRLLYPADPSAPAEDTVQCRCGVTTRFKKPK